MITFYLEKKNITVKKNLIASMIYFIETNVLHVTLHKAVLREYRSYTDLIVIDVTEKEYRNYLSQWEDNDVTENN